MKIHFKGPLIKFGAEEHLRKLQKEGLVYCRPIQYFRNLEESNQVRADKYETVVEIVNLTDYFLEIADPLTPTQFKRIAYLTKGQMLTTRADEFGNVFCLYHLNIIDRNSGEIFSIDEKNRQFGTHQLIIQEPAIFINRLAQKITEMGFQYSCNYVEYLDFSQHNGKKNIFQKDLLYNYQNEFRVFIQNSNSEILEFNIGDISNISTLSVAGGRFKIP